MGRPWLHKLLNHAGLLRSAAKRSHMTSAREHGEMALAMLRIEGSPFGKELDKLIDWLATEKPDVLCLGTALQAGMIRELKRRLDSMGPVNVDAIEEYEDVVLDAALVADLERHAAGAAPRPIRCWRARRSSAWPRT